MVDTISKLIEAAKNLLSFLTLGKLVLILATGIVGIILVSGWEKRTVVSEFIMKADKFSSSDLVLVKLSLETEASLKSYVASDTNIVAIQVLSTDFNRMIRDTVFFYSKRRELQQDFETFHENKKAPTPVMAVNEIAQNTRMIGIINQQFVCVPLTPSILRSIPSSPKYAKQICSVSVPPRYGDMVGYITIWLIEPLDESNVDYYHNLARLLADQIYKKDIVRRQSP